MRTLYFLVFLFSLSIETIGQEAYVADNIVEEETTSAGEPSPDEKKKKSKLKSELSGFVEGEYKYFPKDGLYPGQRNEFFSAIFSPEIYTWWDNGNQLIQFKGFARLNQYDNQQTHVDIRELYYQRIHKSLEISVGLKKIYWGFTESNHLVNIINQDDALEGNDIENKLGQPMLHVSTVKNWGVLDVMVMPYHRVLRFPGEPGRLRPPFQIDNNDVIYETKLEEYNPDFAVRWSHSVGAFDMGFSNFYGNSRLPLFVTNDGMTFKPIYELINQTGLEFQATTGALLMKLEAIHIERKSRKANNAFTAGGEFTFSNVFNADVGLIAEYSYDDRGIELFTGLDDDFFFGTRIALNDRQSTDFLGGVVIDRTLKTTRILVEANRRLGDSWKLSIEMFIFSNVHPSEFTYLIRNDSFGQVALAKYF